MTWCGTCKQECYVYSQDEGYGLTEFWGVKSVHTDICHYSECCDGEVLEERPAPPWMEEVHLIVDSWEEYLYFEDGDWIKASMIGQSDPDDDWDEFLNCCDMLAWVFKTCNQESDVLAKISGDER